jgi:hypothetical protein
LPLAVKKYKKPLCANFTLKNRAQHYSTIGHSSSQLPRGILLLLLAARCPLIGWL